MTITSAHLQNYRSYIDDVFEFSPDVNIIVGPNASGKTNLLDALYFIASGGSIKLSRDSIIRDEQAWARVDGLTSTNQARVIKVDPNEKSVPILIDEKKYKKLPFDMVLPVVLFEPNHLYFITTSPEMRRQLIDEILDKTDSEFNRLKNTYQRTLKQRNSLLKQPLQQVKKQIFAWDIRLSELAGNYVKKRQDLLRKINDDISNVYSAIASKKNKLELRYESKVVGVDYASKLLFLLQQKLELDHMRGFTGYGPHRDDIAIVINTKDMRDVASRGETRSILLTLKVIESQILEKVHQKKPIFLLDDVFGELDNSRRKRLIEFMRTNQTFITTTDADAIDIDKNKSRIVSVSKE